MSKAVNFLMAAFFLVGSVIVPVSVNAQSSTTGSVEGVVTDSNGAVVPNASVVLSGPGLLRPQTSAADANGNWRVSFSARKADGQPHRIVVTGTNTIVLEDVLIGEVWIGSGQSNMEWPVSQTDSAERAMKKIQMFNEGGEIAIFRRVGMRPVFFGQTLIGSKLPNLTYMLEFDNEQTMTTAWNGFRGDADWKKLSGDETYTDTVSNITNLVLRPVEGSAI